MRNALQVGGALMFLVSASPESLRGDLIEFTLELDRAQVLQCTGTTSLATGSGSFLLDTNTGMVDYFIEYSGLGSPDFAGHVHRPQTPCDILLAVYTLPIPSPIVGQVSLTPQEQTDMVAGLHIVVIHTLMVLGGEIWGEILPVQIADDFRRSDCNGDGNADIADAIFELGTLFSMSGLPIFCFDACDGNDDGQIDIADPIFLLTHLFAMGPPSPPPFPTCGSDPTADLLPCVYFGPCP